MKSQKVRNRAPRPFKKQGSQHGWSDGGGFIPVSKKPALPVKKATSGTTPSASPPSAKD